jgi:hypothetical protein
MVGNPKRNSLGLGVLCFLSLYKDDAYVIKQLSAKWGVAEKDSLLEFAPKYFEYMRSAVDVFSCLLIRGFNCNIQDFWFLHYQTQEFDNRGCDKYGRPCNGESILQVRYFKGILWMFNIRDLI